MGADMSQPDISLALLEALYEAFDQEADDAGLACGPGCAACCTDQVRLTTLEGRLLLKGLEQAGRPDLLDKALAMPDTGEPFTSFNHLARLCLSRREPEPEPEAPQTAGRCPLLENERCAVYPFRAMTCRAVVSNRKCEPGGQAVSDSWRLTLSTAFSQLVEAADPRGGFGPLSRVLGKVSGREVGDGLAKCEALPGILAPHEHQARLDGVIRRISAKPVLGVPLGLRLNELNNKG
jgi:Fe-S-cluster containining protein